MTRTEMMSFAEAFYAAFTGGDPAGLRERIAEDAAWHVGGANTLTGTYRGHDEIFALFARIGELSGGTFSLEIHDLLASDDHVVALVTVHGTKDGRSVSERIVHVIHASQGRLTEFRGFPESSPGFDDFWK